MNEAVIWRFFKSKGFSDCGIAGLMGNLFAESGLNPINLQNSFEKTLKMDDTTYTLAVDSGAYTNFVKDGAGYGLAQWTYWSRKQNLLNFARARGTSIGDLSMQLDFLYQEFQGYKGLNEALRMANSVQEASNLILFQYERPADQGAKVQAKRTEYGMVYYKQFANVMADHEGDDVLNAVERLIATARAEVGYLEKATNSQLDDKTANPGKNNWTKYARDLDKSGCYNGPKNGYAWCDMFVDWCFRQTFGEELIHKMTFQPHGGYGAGCTSSAGYYKQAGRFFKSGPKPGDQIFFTNDGGKSSSHTGIVVAVDGSKVYTIEGNTSSVAGVVANGGCVREKSYSLSYDRIYGYGRPDWSIVPETPIDKKEDEDDMDVKRFGELLSEFRKTLQDNDSGEWSKPAREWAIAQGLVAGNGTKVGGKTNYMWEDFLTREQLVTVLYRFAQVMGMVK